MNTKEKFINYLGINEQIDNFIEPKFKRMLINHNKRVNWENPSNTQEKTNESEGGNSNE